MHFPFAKRKEQFRHGAEQARRSRNTCANGALLHTAAQMTVAFLVASLITEAARVCRDVGAGRSGCVGVVAGAHDTTLAVLAAPLTACRVVALLDVRVA